MCQTYTVVIEFAVVVVFLLFCPMVMMWPSMLTALGNHGTRFVS